MQMIETVKPQEQAQKRNEVAMQLKEVWQQDQTEHDLWHAPTGLMINTSALEERESYFQIIRVPAKGLSA